MSIDSSDLIHNVFSLSNIRHICFLDLYGGFIMISSMELFVFSD